MDWMREMISNLYKNKNEEKNSKNIRKKKWWRKCNSKVESNGEIKKQKGRGNVGGSVTVNVNKHKE